MTDWNSRLDELISSICNSDTELSSYAYANSEAIERAIAGLGTDENNAEPGAGARMTVNMSSVHIPAFCKASMSGEPKPYKNGYDLGNYRIGDPPNKEKLRNREIVDRALPLQGKMPSDVYFGAVELNGAGIRFYGDVCLVIGRNVLDENTQVLDRNSYDLIRAPISHVINARSAQDQETARKSEAERLLGRWNNDTGLMASTKVIPALGPRRRRYTTGQISEGVCNDEDYMEVLKIDSFGTNELEEARISAAEAAHDALTSDRLRTHPVPRMEDLIWRNRRRQAEEELRRCGLSVRIITSSGRMKN